MPSRSITLLIVAFWLVATGLFVTHDLWPRLMPAEPLMFPVDIVDEAGQRTEVVNYNVSKNQGQADTYRAEVEWRYHPENDSFESQCLCDRRWTDPEPSRTDGPPSLPQIHGVSMNDSYFLTRGGEMLAMAAKTDYLLAPGNDDKGAVKASAAVRGFIRNGRFTPHMDLTLPQLTGDTALGSFPLQGFTGDGESVPLTGRHIVLNPLHPPRRFSGLTPGQSWRVAVIDPFVLPPSCTASRAALEPQTAHGAGCWTLEAQVLPDSVMVDWQGGTDVSCRLVRCTGAGPISPLTFWVRETDGVVMRQEVTVAGDLWTFVRLPQAFKMRSPPEDRKTP